MSENRQRSNAEVLDILFAVALGEGFITGMFEYKPQLISGAAFTLGEPGQGLYRIVLAFVIIILSWLYFRRDTMTNRDYPSGEFVTDVLVAVSYMTLFLLVDAPAAYYWALTVIWFFYAIARAFADSFSAAHIVMGAMFVVAFGIIAVSAMLTDSDVAEWTRLLAATALVVVYRPIDQHFTKR